MSETPVRRPPEILHGIASALEAFQKNGGHDDNSTHEFVPRMGRKEK